MFKSVGSRFCIVIAVIVSLTIAARPTLAGSTLDTDLHDLETRGAIPFDAAVDPQGVAKEPLRSSKDPTFFDELHGEFEKLLEKYEAPEDRGRICMSRLLRYCRSGPKVPAQIILFAEDALSYPISPEDRMEAFLAWGKALWRLGVAEAKEPLEVVRAKVARKYVQGLREAETLDLPYGPIPEPPRGGGVVGSGPLYEEMRREMDRRAELWEAHRAIESKVAKRAELERALLYLYALKPRNREELASLCGEYLARDEAIQFTLEKLDMVIDELEGRPIEGESVLRPGWPREVLNRMKYKEADKLLENATVGY